MRRIGVAHIIDTRGQDMGSTLEKRINRKLKQLEDEGYEIIDIKFSSTAQCETDYGSDEALIIYQIVNY